MSEDVAQSFGNLVEAVSEDVVFAFEGHQERLKRLCFALDEIPRSDEAPWLPEVVIGMCNQLSEPIKAYCVGLHAAMVVDLYAYIERVAIECLAHHYGKDDMGEAFINGLLSRKTLPELSGMMREIEVWDNKDVQFSKRLSQIRNGIAHANAELLSKHLGSGREAGLSEARSKLKEIDPLPLLMNSLICAGKALYKHVKERLQSETAT